MARTVIGLGSNLGDRLDTLREATRLIARVSPIVAASSIYANEAIGGPAQGEFLNAAVEVDWSLDPHLLLDELQRIEHALGRVRDANVRWGPRTVDLDVLWIDGALVATDRLVVPHPRLGERPFAFVPLLELVPDVLPGWPVDHPSLQRIEPLLSSS